MKLKHKNPIKQAKEDGVKKIHKATTNTTGIFYLKDHQKLISTKNNNMVCSLDSHIHL